MYYKLVEETLFNVYRLTPLKQNPYPVDAVLHVKQDGGGEQYLPKSIMGRFRGSAPLGRNLLSIRNLTGQTKCSSLLSGSIYMSPQKFLHRNFSLSMATENTKLVLSTNFITSNTFLLLQLILNITYCYHMQVCKNT